MRLLSLSELASKWDLAEHKIAQLYRRGVIAADSHDGNKPRFRETSLPRLEETLKHLTWIAVVTPENWEMLSANGLTYTMLAAREEDWLGLITPGNQVVFYMTRRAALVGAAEVSERPLKRPEVWPGGAYPYRVPLKPRIVLDKRHGLPFKGLVESVSFIVNKKEWGMALHRALLPLNQADGEVVNRALAAHAAKTAEEIPH